MRYASGRFAKGISDRSGFEYPLNKMRLEWTGALVGPDEWEAKHPQLDPPRVPADPQALRNPRPDPGGEPVVVLVGVPTFDAPNNPALRLVSGTSDVEVTVA